MQTLEKSAEWLSGEVERQGRLVQQGELALAQYRERQDAGALDSSQNIVVARLTQLNEALTKARTERIQKESQWRQIQAAGTDPESISSVISNTAVQNLRTQLNTLQQDRARVSERYGEKHPEFIKVTTQLANTERQLESEIKKAVQNAKNEYDGAVTQEREIQGSVNESKQAATNLGRKGVDYSMLQRELDSNRTVYNQLLTREKELRVVANSRTNNVRVVERAQVPNLPITPNHKRDWAYAIALGLALALGMAFGIDYLDDTVKTPEDVTRRLKLKFLGLVPIVAGDRHPLISGPVPHDFGEAYRSIRTALAGQFPGDGARVVAVASSQPLEGKTTTAVNIAMALAVGGARVLLIDADMRRPSVHKALRMTNERGLSQLLAGQARMREVVQRTHDPNLLAITAGRTPANPSELLASDRMRALLTGLETGPFEWIIIDTPPVLAVTDALILAPLVGAVTFVIGAEMTRWRLAEQAVETLLGSNPRQVLSGAQQGQLQPQQVLLLALLRPPIQELLRRVPRGLTCAARAAHLPRRIFLPALRRRSTLDSRPPAPAGDRRRSCRTRPDAGVSAAWRRLDVSLALIGTGDPDPVGSAAGCAARSVVAAHNGSPPRVAFRRSRIAATRLGVAHAQSRSHGLCARHGGARHPEFLDRARAVCRRGQLAEGLPRTRDFRGRRRTRRDGHRRSPLRRWCWAYSSLRRAARTRSARLPTAITSRLGSC